MGMDDPVPGNLADQIKGCTLIFIGFEGKPEDEIDHRDKRVVPAQVNGTEHVGNGMPTVELCKNSVAAGLGAEMKFCVGTVLRDKRQRLVADELRPDLAWERPEEDLAPALPEQMLNLVPPVVAPV